MNVKASVNDKSYLEGDWEAEWITANPPLGDVIVPEMFSPYVVEAMRNKMAVPDESRDAIKLLREMLRQAERGEVVLCGLSVKNQQPDRWEVAGSGAERLRLDNRFKITLEMRAYDRFAQSQPPSSAAAVDVDDRAMEVLSPTPIEYVTLQGRTAYRLPAQPIKTLPDRIVQRIAGSAAREYDTLRISYETRDRLMLEGILDARAMTESPVRFLGLDLMIEAADGRAVTAGPRFEDDEAEARDWEGITDYDIAMGRTMARRRPPSQTELQALDARAADGRRKAREAAKTKTLKEKAKPKTPAGASAAREIIFDD